MKFALVNGQRQEAQPHVSGYCPGCSDLTIAKCGEQKMWHWAHNSTALCDPWWETESEWHRDWKGQFPVNWQEFVHKAKNGERHIADVRTNHGWVIEFQRSYLNPDERRSRDSFYQRLVWVIDATRRKTDAEQFGKALAASTRAPWNPFFLRLDADECRLLQEWSGSAAPTFFDFGSGPTLWALLAKRPNEPVYVAPFARTDFIAIHHGNGPEGARDFDEFARNIIAPANEHFQAQSSPRSHTLPVGLSRPLARRSFRRRF